MISLGLKFHSLSQSSLVTSVLPTYSQVVDGQDALITAEPYADRTIARFLALGTAAPATKPTGSSTSSSSTTTTPPATGVVTDTPQSLPEPWNPVPC
jgi:hypothetical protein